MVKGKKQLLSQILWKTGIDRVLRQWCDPRLMVFNFHRIRPDSADFCSEFDDEVFGPTVSEFRRQMIWLKKNTRILTEKQLLDVVQGRRELEGVSTLITFDDGYADNYSLAWPVLRDLGVPAIFFIPTQSITDRGLGWWDLIAYFLKKTTLREISLRGARFDLSKQEDAKRALLDILKLEPASGNTGLIEELARACGVQMPSRETCSKELMTWDQVQELAEQGLTIGSHSHSSDVLSTLTLAQQKEQLEFSKIELEKRIQRPVRTVAYPVGGYEHFNLETKALARDCGYEAGFSFTHEVNSLENLRKDPFCIRRLVPDLDLSITVGVVSCPSLFVKKRSQADASVLAAS